jgi:uncharacterized Zn finger protein (UPF0148 family)
MTDKEFFKFLESLHFPEDTRERLIINEFPQLHILTSLKWCPSCGGGKLSIFETNKQSFLFCPSCNNVIYEMEIKKRYFSPSDFKIYERQEEKLNRISEESSRIWEEKRYLNKLQVITNLNQTIRGQDN